MLPDLVPIRSALASLDGAADRDSLRGLEGSAAVGYFRGLARLLGPTVPESLRYTTRSRRPPLDRFNALLGFGYGLLHTAVMRAILAAGLEPSLGFFHTPRSAAYPLVLDLMELFRVPLWDMVLVGSLNRGQWDPDADFVATKGEGLALRRRPPQGDRPVRGAARRDLEAPGDRLLAVVRPDARAGGPAAGEGVERRAGPVRPDAAPLIERHPGSDRTMNDAKWWLVCYDVHDPARLRRAAKILEGSGQRMQVLGLPLLDDAAPDAPPALGADRRCWSRRTRCC